MERIQASERTRERLKALMEGRGEATDERSELVRLAARLIVEEGLEAEATDAVGRGYYEHGATPGRGYRNGYRPGRLKSAEGAIAFSAPQIADRSEPFRSRLREMLQGRTEALESLAVEMYARGLSTRDIEALFADGDGRSLLSRTAVSEITERLWAEYEAFASRDLSEFEVIYLFVDGIAERLHLGQPREAVLAAWGILADGGRALLHLAPGTKEDTASCREFFQDLHRRGLPDPLLVASDGAPGQATLSRPQDAQPAEQGAGQCLAGVPGPRPGLLSRGFAGVGTNAARRHRRDLWQRPALGRGLSRRRLRGLHRAPEVPPRASPHHPHHQPARAPVRRGAKADQDHPACLRRARRLEADVCRADPCRRALARLAHH